MNKTDLVTWVIIILMFLAALPVFWGRKVPKMVWIVACISAGAIGAIFGSKFPSPMNIIASIILAAIFIGMALVLWLPIRLRRK